MIPNLIHRGATYKTKSNRRVRVVTKTKKVKNILVGKKGKVRRCGDCERKLLAIPALRTHKFARLNKSQKRVSRPLGGTHCGKCVSKKIISAFLEEESKANLNK